MLLAQARRASARERASVRISPGQLRAGAEHRLRHPPPAWGVGAVLATVGDHWPLPRLRPVAQPKRPIMTAPPAALNWSIRTAAP